MFVRAPPADVPSTPGSITRAACVSGACAPSITCTSQIFGTSATCAHARTTLRGPSCIRCPCFSYRPCRTAPCPQVHAQLQGRRAHQGAISPVRNAASVARRSVRFRPAEWAPAAQPDWVRSAPVPLRGHGRARTPSSPHSTGAAGSMRPFAACRAHAGVPGRGKVASSVAPRSGLLSRGSSSTIMSSTHRRQRRRRPRRVRRLSRSGVTITTSAVAYRPARVEGS